MPRSTYLDRIKNARTLLSDQGKAPSGMLPEPIERSWSRCLDSGLSLELRPSLEPLAQQALLELREQNSRLLHQAMPEMENLYSQIAGTHNMVMLTDAGGTILHAMGDADFTNRAQRVALQPGVSWSEKNTGTNAIGTALVEQTPIFVAGKEHYVEQNGFLNCSAAPIFGAHGEVIGVLDVSGDYRQPQAHTLALVRMSAQMIENRLFSVEFPHDITLRFHSRPEFIGTLWEGIAVFQPDGQLLALNRSAMFLLGLDEPGQPAKPFDSLFEGSLATLLDAAQRSQPQSTPCTTRTGQRLFVRVNAGLAASVPRHATAAEASDSPASAKLDLLDTGDSLMHKAVLSVRKVLGRDIPIIIEGETGTGKELLAKAIHVAQGRKGQFVAINCASIPEGLIEAELFGYEDGAFTGARRRGASGKLLQANGGTLFLDEIGEMPLHLQARLLRVLQEREIVPLGGSKGIAVDFALISATNRKLFERVEQGLFREDLYYRINGLRVSLPPLRQRSDLEVLIAQILREETGHAITLHAETLQLLRRHPWRGNIRQLRNVLRAALAFVEDGHLIEPQHLPEDFMEELGKISASLPPASPANAPERASSEIATIREALRAHGGNMTAAARHLGIGRATLYRRIKRLNIR